ncbi:hypothetical protein [Candidatus Venteria ishoeyi]|uniref:Uncharacterized protein n=1 Tax=Candidatus Venteria ishoeyi TaxID=1899563 RepID=A0A1H6F8U2_9GAMM|nr:hypothetical protein [Candidatus Venteria ishoeyi]SEH06548.1 Uncharacterised protein [Candidatus Venteria ishoeyi]
MSKEQEVTSEAAHDACHNPCEECRSKGSLENGEICPACAGTGCKDKQFCVPAGGLGCDIE